MLTLSNYLLDLYRVYVSGDEFRANVLKISGLRAPQWSLSVYGTAKYGCFLIALKRLLSKAYTLLNKVV